MRIRRVGERPPLGTEACECLWERLRDKERDIYILLAAMEADCAVPSQWCYTSSSC